MESKACASSLAARSLDAEAARRLPAALVLLRLGAVAALGIALWLLLR